MCAVHHCHQLCDGRKPLSGAQNGMVDVSVMIPVANKSLDSDVQMFGGASGYAPYPSVPADKNALP